MDMRKTFENRLSDWYEITQKLAELKKQEMEMRKALFGEAFPQATEGTNTFELSTGDLLKGDLKYKYTVDQAVLNQIEERLLKEGVSLEDLFKVKREVSLNLTKYRKLDPTKRKLVDRCITVKPASPTLKIDS